MSDQWNGGMAPSAKMLGSLDKKAGREPVYKWREVELMKSFSIPEENMKFKTLQNMASRTGKRLGKRFKVLHHSDLKCYEVCLVEITSKLPTEQPNNVPNDNVGSTGFKGWRNDL